MTRRKAVGSFVAITFVNRLSPMGVFSVKLSSSMCQFKDFSVEMMYSLTMVLFSVSAVQMKHSLAGKVSRCQWTTNQLAVSESLRDANLDWMGQRCALGQERIPTLPSVLKTAQINLVRQVLTLGTNMRAITPAQLKWRDNTETRCQTSLEWIFGLALALYRDADGERLTWSVYKKF